MNKACLAEAKLATFLFLISFQSLFDVLESEGREMALMN